MWTCKECGLVLNSGRQGSNHVRWYHKKIKFNEEKYFLKKKIANDITYGKKILKIKNCAICKASFTVETREKKSEDKQKKCCSKSCAAKLSQSYVDTKNISKSISKKWKNDLNFAKKCSNRPDNKYFTSKAERDIRDWFKKRYEDWSHGIICKYKWNYLSVDLYNKNLKIIFEYDGVWHFKDIHGQLKRKKLKDKLLERWCLKNNWRLVRLSETMYNAFGFDYWIKQLNDCFYNNPSRKQITKYYSSNEGVTDCVLEK